MISLGKLLAKKADAPSAPLTDLLSGIGETAVETEAGQRLEFRDKLQPVADRILKNPENHTVASDVAQVVALLNEHNRKAEGKATAQQRELRDIIRASTETITALTNTSQTGIQQLKSLEASLENASKLDDLRQLRNRLFACLTMVRQESMRVQADTHMVVRTLRTSVLKASAELVPGTDATTGLPGPAAVASALSSSGPVPAAHGVALCVIEDLAGLNSRHGRVAGDELLRLTSEHFAASFPKPAAVYRWNGPAFAIVVSEADGILDDFESKVNALCRAGFAPSIAVHGVMKTLSVTFCWTVQRLAPGDSVEDCCRKLDTFVTRQAGIPAL